MLYQLSYTRMRRMPLAGAGAGGKTARRKTAPGGQATAASRPWLRVASIRASDTGSGRPK